MYSPLGIKTDYSLLQSLIKVKDVVKFAKDNCISCLGMLDDNLSGSHVFYQECINNGIKSVIGLITYIEGYKVYLYPRTYNGLSNLFRYSKFIIDNKIDFETINNYLEEVIVVLPSESYSILDKFKNVFLSYKNNDEEVKARVLNKYVVYINEVMALNKDKAKYVNYLELIKTNKVLGELEFNDYSNNVLEIKDIDTSNFTDLIDIKFPENKRFIPHFSDEIEDSYDYLVKMANKGLDRRLNGNVSKEYQDRLDYELKIISSMGFTDYFLIVFDYVRFAIKNDIYVGAGRGSAAGSLVAYALGITWIDPLKYDLLFERFLNPERITMPDIDVDFEDEKRELVVDYVKEKYGLDRVGHILTYGTMTAKEVVRLVGKINKLEDKVIDSLTKYLDSKISLTDNYLKPEVKRIVDGNSNLKKVYSDSLNLEGLKKHIGTHAAGVVISSIPLDTVVPILSNGNDYLIGYDKDELEGLGLIKMDFLSIKNLTLLTNVIKDVEKNLNRKININNINLDDPKVLELFRKGNTVGIFQFESEGMKNFLRRMKPNCFQDLFLANSIYRPSASASIEEFLRRRDKGIYKYPSDNLEDILKSTHGILIYQEQVMKILNLMANYSFAEADIIRRAISKKKASVIEENRIKFIERSVANGYSEETANVVFDDIYKFASFGFNKSHAVAYAMISYQMAFLKTYFEEYFFINLLNINIGGEAKTKEYIDEAKSNGIKFLKPNVNNSKIGYSKEEEGIRIPLRVIKGVGYAASNAILEERENGEFKDFFDFIKRCYGNSIKKNVLEALIYAGAFEEFGDNRATLIKNIDSCIMYADLAKSLDDSLVSIPELKETEEYSDIELMKKEVELFGYYVSSHPASKYPKVMKLFDVRNYFDKNVETVILIDRLKTLKTKKDEDMAFITGSDETSSLDFVIFSNTFNQLYNISVGDLVKVFGHVERRNDKFQIIVNKIEKV